MVAAAEFDVSIVMSALGRSSPEDTATQNIATSGWNGKDLTAELEELTGQEELSI